MEGPPMSAPADCPANPFDRYGLQGVEEPAQLKPQPRAEPSSSAPGQLGMSPRKAQALLRLERACADSPELRAAFSSGRVSWVQAHALVLILVLEHAEPWCAAWVAHAESVSVRRVDEDVEHALVTGELDPCSLSPDVQTGAHPTVSSETIKFFLAAPADV